VETREVPFLTKPKNPCPACFSFDLTMKCVTYTSQAKPEYFVCCGNTVAWCHYEVKGFNRLTREGAIKAWDLYFRRVLEERKRNCKKNKSLVKQWNT